MSDPADPGRPRQSKAGAVFVAVAVAASAAGVLGWHLLQNRGERERLDVSGFDLSAAPTSARPDAPLSAAPDAPAPASSLGMLKADAGIRVVDANASGASASAPANAATEQAKKREDARLTLQQAARKHEKTVHAYFLRVTRKYPSVRQYGRDWMSYPDLKKLNDDYFKNRDPVQFLKGLSKSDNFGKMVKKYSTDPAIRAVVVDAAKQAPADVMSAAMDYLQNDRVIKDLLGGVAKGMGLPASLMAVFDDSKGAKVDQNKVMADIMKSNPDVQKATEQQKNSGIQIGR